MPFTFSHPAAVLPFRLLPRKWVSFSGLVFGSMIPDFEFYIRMNAEVNFSHTIADVFLFDLPAGNISLFIFYNIVANPLIENVPRFLAARISFLKNTDWNSYFKKNWVIVSLSIIVGAVLHIAWDNVTHEHGHFSNIIPGTTENFELFGIHFWRIHLLQHISTLLGGLIVGLYVWRLPTDPNYTSNISVKYWCSIVVISLIVISLRVWFGLGTNWFYNFIVSAISAGMIAITITPIIMWRSK